MTPKLLLLAIAAIGMAPAVLWSFISIVIAAVSIAYRPVSLSFRLYSSPGSAAIFEYRDLPLLTSLFILGGAALLIVGIVSIPRGE
jgi:hypothetical protein